MATQNSPDVPSEHSEIKSVPRYSTSGRTIVIDGYPFRHYRWSDGEFGYREPNYRAVRLFLIKKYKVCYFCQKPVKDYPHKDGERRDYVTHPDLGTIDHLYPRANEKNAVGRKKYESVEKVLCCALCNHQRNIKYYRGINLGVSPSEKAGTQVTTAASERPDTDDVAVKNAPAAQLEGNDEK